MKFSVRMKSFVGVAVFLVVSQTATAVSTLQTYEWPLEVGQAVRSGQYRVTVSNGRLELDSEVLVSESWDEPGGGPDVFRGRTFSWTAFSSSFSSPIAVVVEKLFGEPATQVEVFPSSYGIEAELDSSGMKVTFTLSQPRYVSVNFKTADNLHAKEDVVKHMMMVFADEEERDVPQPGELDVLLFSNWNGDIEQLKAAETVLFEPGFYDLKQFFLDGILPVFSKQTVYIAGGAFLSGKIRGEDLEAVEVRGRGVVSGRDWAWVPGLPIASLIELKGNRVIVEGIIACDNDMHGIVPGSDAVLKNVKLWGWHYNNDGFRPWGGRVDHCFLRPVDDAFYVGGRPLVVTDTVIWQGFNGAVVTCGWGSNERPYDTHDFRMENCDILYPEWNGIGNNNGILASQLPYAAESSNIHFRNVMVDGNIVAITNLKRNEKLEKTGVAGGISNVSFENLRITGRQIAFDWQRRNEVASFSRIRGEDEFRIKDVTFDRVSIGGTLLNEENALQYFEIDPATTSEIRFLSNCD